MRAHHTQANPNAQQLDAVIQEISKRVRLHEGGNFPLSVGRHQMTDDAAALWLLKTAPQFQPADQLGVTILRPGQVGLVHGPLIRLTISDTSHHKRADLLIETGEAITLAIPSEKGLLSLIPSGLKYKNATGAGGFILGPQGHISAESPRSEAEGRTNSSGYVSENVASLLSPFRTKADKSMAVFFIDRAAERKLDLPDKSLLREVGIEFRELGQEFGIRISKHSPSQVLLRISSARWKQ